VQILVGQQTAVIDISVIDDSLVEGAETVTLALTGTSHPQVGFNATAATVTIADDDNPPVIDDASVALPENSPNGTPVYNVDDGGDDTDADGDPLTYSITGGTGFGVFAIDPATGLITVANSAALDFETMPSSTLTVLADDGNGNTDTATITINLTNVNEVPVNTVPPGPLAATEDTPLAVGGISITDPDGGTINVSLSVTNGRLTVSLAGGATITGGASGSGALTLSGTVAQVNTALASLGYQGLANYFGPDALTVTSTDPGGLSDNDTVAITVAAVNDTPALGNNSFTINEGGTLVLTSGNLSASDVDNPAGTLLFTIGGIANGHFELVSNPRVPIGGFTQQQVLNGQVKFVHDGPGAPGFSIFVSDGAANIGPIAANISFNGGGFVPSPPPGSGSTTPPPSVLPPTPSTKPPAASDPGATNFLRSPATPRSEGGEGEEGSPVAQVLAGVVAQDKLRVPGMGLPPVRAEATVIETQPARHNPEVPPIRAEMQMLPTARATFDPDADEERLHIELVLDSVRMTGIAMSVGAVWWAARAAGIVASVLASSPAWRHVDPLPVLGRDEEEEEEIEEEQDKEKKDDEHRAAWVLEERGAPAS
jgi:hypothetical protein